MEASKSPKFKIKKSHLVYAKEFVQMKTASLIIPENTADTKSKIDRIKARSRGDQLNKKQKMIQLAAQRTLANKI